MDNYIYVNQTALRLQLNTSIDLSDATSAVIKYIKPDGTTGSWTATISSAVQGIIVYDIQSNDLSQEGDYTIWAYITFTSGKTAPGRAQHIYVYPEGV